ncbi:hypothetical protein KTH81_20200 [Lachnospiraceae bacterium ASD3451]|uniref:hypothetical protein n=1 Tax=Diplocloster agilis TaxID=2850323 RepID=UPI001D84734F|nr:hypothetical protein [Diplocloster agilis]MBU9746148.1 hypothetical protein [Diplocloster agilis]
MADANITIDSAKITPNPVETGGTFILSVGISNKIFALLDTDGNYIMAIDNASIEYI